MATAGPNAASAASGWTNSSNVYVQDSTYATNSVSAGSNSATLKAQGFGFVLATDSTINGFTVIIWKRAAASLVMKDNSIHLLDSSGVATGNNKASGSYWSSTNTASTYGSSSDVWGTTLTPTDVNSSNFGVQLVAHNDDSSSWTASVDYVSVTVDYTAASGQPMQARSRLVPFVNKSRIGW